MARFSSFAKCCIGIFLGHLLILSLVWVGFSIPLPKKEVQFVFLGDSSLDRTSTVSNPIIPEGFKVGADNWQLEKKGISKPRSLIKVKS